MRLLVHVEGQTEESFVNEILRPHLTGHGFSSVSARLLGNARLRSHRGGARAWSAVRKEVLNHLRGDPGCSAATMADFYALPAGGPKAWPGRRDADRKAIAEKAVAVEKAMVTDLAEAAPDIRSHRFVPLIFLHEFEGLLFSDCDAFAAGIGAETLAPELQSIRDQFETPEFIDDGPETAPSKRVLKLFPAYQKPLFGTLAALEIGLEAIREQCPHFAGWLTKIEALGARR